jgi:hypothetical protein
MEKKKSLYKKGLSKNGGNQTKAHEMAYLLNVKSV